jgi:dTDP-4-dehydrorhamnose reductase
MKILIIGGTGMLGHKAVQILQKKFDTYVTVRNQFSEIERFEIFEKAHTFTEVEIENSDALRNIIDDIKPVFIINAVGIIKQLESSKNVIKTLTVNSIFPHKLAEAAAENGAKVITVSTDCVFRGDKGNYKEEDISDAIDLYGKSKYLGELYADHCLTLRTSIIGREIGSEHSLVEWFLSNRGGKVKGFTNAIYSGFPTIVLVEIMSNLIAQKTKLHGLYHLASRPINKYELIKLINEKFNAGVEIEPFADFYIDRSLNAEKFQKAAGFAVPEWKTMIERMADDPTPYDHWRKPK